MYAIILLTVVGVILFGFGWNFWKESPLEFKTSGNSSNNTLFGHDYENNSMTSVEN